MSDLTDVVVDAPVEAPALPLPGAVLRAAREANGYSLSEISQVLKFSVRQLEALESDDYSTLQGSTFIRGFVRSYARYLKLDEAPLLAALEPKAPVVSAEVQPIESTGAEMPTGSPDGSKRAYGVAAGVLLLGVLAWFAMQGKPEQPRPAELAAPAPTTLASPEATSQEQAATAKSDVQAKPAEVESIPPVSAAASPAAPAASAVEPAVSAADTAAPVANPNERQLSLSFSDVSWVEVRDASQKILYSGRSTPDSRQVVRGRPPFQLVIGNAQSVKLRYEDRSIDLQPYTRVDVARLTLDDNTK
jgi:cytoskeleton protein RodZ